MLIITLLQVISIHCLQYTVHLANNNETLYAVKHIYKTVSKKVNLWDGRSASCNIPVHRLLEPFKFELVKNLTHMDLLPLQGLCVQHRTFEFLYEFCFGKHLRQFDDDITVHNAKKQFKEDMSIGYSQFQNSTNEAFNYNLDTYIYNLVEGPFIAIDGCVAKLRSHKFDLYYNQEYKIRVVHETQTFEFKVLVVLHNKLLILTECSSRVLLSNDFQVINVRQQDMLVNISKVTLYKNLIFSMALRTNLDITIPQQLGIFSSDYMVTAHVVKIPDFCVIQIDKQLSRVPKYLNNIVLLDQYRYSQLQDDVIVNNKFAFMSLRDSQKYTNQIAIIDNSKMLSPMTHLQIVHRDGQLFELSSSAQHRGRAYLVYPLIRDRIHVIDFDSHSYLNDLQTILIDKTIKGYHYRMKLPKKEYTGFEFSFMKRVRVTDWALHIQLNSRDHQIMIHFLRTPEERVYITDRNNEYIQMESRFENKTILGLSYWVFIDAEYIYIGQNRTINLANSMLSYKLRSSTVQEYTVTVTGESHGVSIQDLVPIPLLDYKSNGYHQLNYTLTQNSVYSEQFINGTLCEPLNATRNSTVTMSCTPETLLKFISITEPDMCIYNVSIGSSLLCENKTSIQPPQKQQHVVCILS